MNFIVRIDGAKECNCGRFFLYKSVVFPMVLALPQSSFGYWYIIKAFQVAPGIELAKQPGFCLGMKASVAGKAGNICLQHLNGKAKNW